MALGRFLSVDCSIKFYSSLKWSQRRLLTRDPDSHVIRESLECYLVNNSSNLDTRYKLETPHRRFSGYRNSSLPKRFLVFSGKYLFQIFSKNISTKSVTIYYWILDESFGRIRLKNTNCFFRTVNIFLVELWSIGTDRYK